VAGPLPPLVAADDADLVLFKAGAEDFFVKAAMSEVRKFCGWHVAPSNVEVNVRRGITRDGVILLNSLYVTDVAAVQVDGRTLVSGEYSWEECGLIHRTQPSWPRDDYALVSFTHGYPEAPPDVKAVVFELMSAAKDRPSGNLKSLGSLSYSYTFADRSGVSMSPEQQSRLASYRVVTFG
jgi:hypothetical protein